MSTLITNIGELVTNAPEGDSRAAGPGSFASTPAAALVIDAGQVAWTGPAARAPAADEVVDAAGRAVLPGFVDSHAHLVFAGERGAEFAARMAGLPYSAGGIRSTVAATRAASDEQLFPEAGGLLIRDADGEVIGAVGVTGDTGERDEELAAHGIHAAGLKTDEDCRHMGRRIGLIGKSS